METRVKVAKALRVLEDKRVTEVLIKARAFSAFLIISGELMENNVLYLLGQIVFSIVGARLMKKTLDKGHPYARLRTAPFVGARTR